MKKIASLLFLIFITNCYSQEKKCKAFINGKFKYENLEYANFIVTRNDTLQTEVDNVKKISVEGSVKWISDCAYVLTYTKVNLPSLQNLIGQKVNVEITNIEDNKITCLSKMNDITLELQMTKIE